MTLGTPIDVGAATVDSENIYWAAGALVGGTAVGPLPIMRMPTTGGTVATITPPVASPARMMIIDGSLVWFGVTESLSDALESMSLSGGTISSIAVGLVDEAAPLPSGVAWTEFPPEGPPGALMTASVPGGAPTTLVSPLWLEGQLVTGGDTVYWTDLLNPCDESSVAILSAPAAGGEVTTLVKANPWELTADEASLYWVDDGGEIISMPGRGGTTVTLVGNPPTASDWPRQLLSDGTSLYFTTTYDVRSLPVAGGIPVTLVSAQSFPYLLSATSADLCWTVVVPLSPYIAESGIEHLAR